MIRSGRSWSGRERNGCYLNLGDGRFAGAPFGSGLDFADDGRAVAATDWDGDGDLDLWLKNRTGPQLRFMLNQGAGDASWVTFELLGTRANRDAIGARVVVTSGERRWHRQLAAGDGYLAQSSKRLHFGLDGAATIDRVAVHWPGGPTEVIPGVQPGRTYRVRQGSATAQPLPPRKVALRPGAPPSVALPAPSRILLKEPLPLSPGWRPETEAGSFSLVNLWAQWCAPCLEELGLLARACDGLAADRIIVEAWNTDEADDRERARQSFDARVRPLMTGPGFVQRPANDRQLQTLAVLLAHVLGRSEELKLPTSLLVDDRGLLQMIYVGAVSPDLLRRDAALLRDPGFGPARRGLYAGRWYFRTPRDLEGLARELRAHGSSDAAAFYETLARARRRPSHPATR